MDMKKSYTAPLVEEIAMAPMGVLMDSGSSSLPKDPAPRRRSRYVE